MRLAFRGMSDPTLKYLARADYRPSATVPAPPTIPSLTKRRKRRVASICTELISHGHSKQVSDDTAAAFHHFCTLASADLDRERIRNAVEEELRGMGTTRSKPCERPPPSFQSCIEPAPRPKKVQYDWGKFITRKRAPATRYLPPRRIKASDEED